MMTEKQQKTADRRSLVDLLYTKSASWLDNFLLKNQEKVAAGGAYAWLQQMRSHYLSLSESKQRSYSFLLTSLLVFVIVTLVTFSFSTGYRITTYWIAFVALNQVKTIAAVLGGIVQFAIYVFLIFLPGLLKDAIMLIVRTLMIFVLAYLLGWIIAPLYLAYRVIAIFLEPASDVSTSQTMTSVSDESPVQ